MHAECTAVFHGASCVLPSMSDVVAPVRCGQHLQSALAIATRATDTSLNRAHVPLRCPLVSENTYIWKRWTAAVTGKYQHKGFTRVGGVQKSDSLAHDDVIRMMDDTVSDGLTPELPSMMPPRFGPRNTVRGPGGRGMPDSKRRR